MLRVTYSLLRINYSEITHNLFLINYSFNTNNSRIDLNVSRQLKSSSYKIIKLYYKYNTQYIHLFEL